MDSPMPKKITYYVQRYRPAYEAISKEVALLAEHFSKDHTTKIFNLHLDGLTSFSLHQNFFSHHFSFYPLTFPYAYALSKKSDINHIYTSLGDLPYLGVLNLQKTILTAAASCNFTKVKKKQKYLHQLLRIIVESEKQKRDLLALGLPEQKIEIIYPPVDLTKFSYLPVTNHNSSFTILYASCPTREQDFEKRGINLLVNTAEQEKNIKFQLLWRLGAYEKIKEIKEQRNISNLHLTNTIVNDINQTYAKAHCTIIPYTAFDDYLKLIPNSAIESLASGKPVLVSSKTEIAAIVNREKCGVVFEPTVVDLSRAIQELRKNYAQYQKNCRKTAEKYFSQEIFLKRYQGVYAEIEEK